MTGRLGFVLAGVCVSAVVSPAYGKVAEYNIPAGDLKAALDAYSVQSNSEIIYKIEEVRGVHSGGVRGAVSPRAALDMILARTGFTISRDSSGALAIVRASTGPKAGADVVDDAEITVTGSRIRGASVSAPVIVRTQKQMLDEGQSDLGEVARSIPQSFGGGQNPGVVGTSGVITNQNVTSGSSFNLRGLGPDATLTLLNGHRLGYDGSFQAIDVSVIPLAAVARLEVVADGASAIYGSDAVGGVANIILNTDYDGVATTARFGASTDGGNEQQQYSLIAGDSWGRGGVLAVIDYRSASAINAADRTYTRNLADLQTIYPEISQVNAVVAGHYEVSDRIRLSMDGTYSHRDAESNQALSATATPFVSGIATETATESFSVSPKAEINLPSDWRATISGTYGQNTTRASQQVNFSGAFLSRSQNLLKNTTENIEIGLEGGIFRVNGNVVRLALGGGYRSNELYQNADTFNQAGVARNVTNYRQANSSYFGYAEAYMPLISPSNDGPLYRLALSAAARYENYNREPGIVTPKFGLAVSPVKDIEFKGTWGESFKTPQVIQMSAPVAAFYHAAGTFGAGYPTTARVVYLSGGNPDLRSERATTATGTVSLTPGFLPGSRLEISYFHISYKDRIAEPIRSMSAVFGTPGLQSLVAYNPSLAEINAAIALAPAGLAQSTAALPLVPANVVAVVNGRFANISRQKIQGVDITLNYNFDIGGAGNFDLGANVSYLDSSQVLIPGQATTELSGIIFNPPSWRGRGTATWSKEAFTFNASINYAGSFVDNRRAPFADIEPSATVDLTARYSTGGTGLFGGVDLSLSALNVLNRKPRAVTTLSATALPFDPTNDSVIGRFVALSITKRW